MATPPTDTHVGVYGRIGPAFTAIYDRLTWRLKIKLAKEKQIKINRNNSP